MKTTAFHLQKGGVGKTTLSVSTAWELSQFGRTALVDADPQGNSSNWLIREDLQEYVQHELADVLYGRVELHRTMVQAAENLDVVPTFSVGGELKQYGENKASEKPFRFMDLVEELADLGYEYGVFDLSPGMHRLEQTILLAVDEVVIPMTPDTFSLDGIETFREAVKDIEKSYRLQKPIRRNRIVVNALNRSVRQHRDVWTAISTREDHDVYTVGQDPVFRKAQHWQTPAQEVGGADRMKPEVRTELQRLAASVGEVVYAEA
jgi:cellulose biosynthesis protein BcsQ